MNTLGRQSWFGMAILIGVVYCVIGIVFALPSHQVRVWRLAAWVVSAAVFAAHLGYEQFRLGNSPRATAVHTALAVAVGAFGLAVAANFHEVWVASNYRRALAFALVAWPALTAVPAFVVALVVAATLARIRRSTYSSTIAVGSPTSAGSGGREATFLQTLITLIPGVRRFSIW